MKEASTIYVISAASGTGKTSLVRALLTALPNIKLSISHTTRLPRSNEQNGIDYYFISKEKFEKMIQQDEFLEYADVFGDYKGTSKAEIQRLSDMKVDIVLEIDVQGAEQVRHAISNAVSVFILPPSREVLKQRILARGEDTAKEIERRLTIAGDEIACYKEYDFLVINDDFDQALSDLKAIVQAQRCRQVMQAEKYQALLAELVE